MSFGPPASRTGSFCLDPSPFLDNGSKARLKERSADEVRDEGF